MKILGIAPLTPAWFEMRKRSITATDVPKILGVSDFGTALDVWGRITGRLTEEEDSERPWLEWGNRTEDMHRKWVGDLAGVCMTGSPGLVQHPDLPWLMATPDGLYVQDQPPQNVHDLIYPPPFVWTGCFEGKAPSPWKGFDPEEEAPLGHQAQVATQLACTGLDEAILSSLSWPAPKWARIGRNRTLEDNLLNGLVNWYEEHIFKDRMPDVLGRDLETLRRFWPKDNGEIVELGADHAQTVERFLVGRETLKDMERECELVEAQVDDLKAKIVAAMGPATYGVMGTTIFKHAAQKRDGYTVKPCEFRTFRQVKEIK